METLSKNLKIYYIILYSIRSGNKYELIGIPFSLLAYLWSRTALIHISDEIVTLQSVALDISKLINTIVKTV